jgi:hypothetical protein
MVSQGFRAYASNKILLLYGVSAENVEKKKS